METGTISPGEKVRIKKEEATATCICLTGIDHHQGDLLVEDSSQKSSPDESVGDVEAGDGEWQTE